jgi:hypothetical protein
VAFVRSTATTIFLFPHTVCMSESEARNLDGGTKKTLVERLAFRAVRRRMKGCGVAGSLP